MHRTPSMPSAPRAYRVLVALSTLASVALGGAACSQTTPAAAPAGAPAPPLAAFGLPGNGSVGIDWYPPSDHSGVTGYKVGAQPGHHTCSTGARPGCSLVGLTNGVVYTVSVQSRGAGGTSRPVGAKVTPGVPWAPGNVTGVIGDSTVRLSWTAPPDSGNPITSYTVTSTPGMIRCRSLTTSCTVTGLTNGTPYSFAVTATNAVGEGAASSSTPPYTPSALAGGSAGIAYLGPVNASQEPTTGTVLQRHTGISVALPNGRDLWILGDTSAFTANAVQSKSFIDGSTTAKGRHVAGQAPTVLRDVRPIGTGSSSSTASSAFQIIPAPSDTYMPDGSGRACTPANGAASTARWPTGAALLDNTAQLLVTYTDVCVTSGGNFTVEGWGWTIYSWRSNKIKTAPVDVFPPAANGAPLPADRLYHSPIVSNGQLTLFTSVCTQLFVSCAAGSVSSTTVPDSLPAMAAPAGYVARPVVADGPTPWTPVGVSVAAYPGGLRLIEQTSIGGTFELFSSKSPAGPWHPLLGGTLPGCSTTPRGFCYAFVGHPELGSSTSLIMSYFKPDSPQSDSVGHVDLASVPTPAA